MIGHVPNISQQNLLAALARHSHVMPSTTRVAFYLLPRLNAVTFQTVDCSTLAPELSMGAHNLQNAVRRLVRIGILVRGPRVGRSHSYRLAPHLASDTTTTGDPPPHTDLDHDTP